MTRASLIVLFVEAVSSSVLLIFCCLLLVRLVSGGEGRLGDDVVFSTYLIAALTSAVLIVSLLLLRDRNLLLKAASIHVLGLISIGFWLCLHIGGFVYSHSSILNNP